MCIATRPAGQPPLSATPMCAERHPRAHLDAAWQRARRCATCRLALDVSNAITMGSGRVAAASAATGSTGGRPRADRADRPGASGSDCLGDAGGSRSLQARVYWSTAATALGRLAADSSSSCRSAPGRRIERREQQPKRAQHQALQREVDCVAFSTSERGATPDTRA